MEIFQNYRERLDLFRLDFRVFFRDLPPRPFNKFLCLSIEDIGEKFGGIGVDILLRIASLFQGGKSLISITSIL